MQRLFNKLVDISLELRTRGSSYTRILPRSFLCGPTLTLLEMGIRSQRLVMRQRQSQDMGFWLLTPAVQSRGHQECKWKLLYPPRKASSSVWALRSAKPFQWWTSFRNWKTNSPSARLCQFQQFVARFLRTIQEHWSWYSETSHIPSSRVSCTPCSCQYFCLSL